MKVYLKSATNTSSLPAKPDIIEAADDEEVDNTLDDKLKSIEDDFDFILGGISQLDVVQGNEIANQLKESLQETIQSIASQLA